MTGGRVHFIGISGAGMSAIAKVMMERGAAVSGSDLKRTPALSVLEAMGAEVTVGHDAAAVEGAGSVVVSAAIPDANPELVRARELGIPVHSRGRALADLVAGSRSVIVAGTHGKTTTTSMIVSTLVAAGLDPTYLVGGGLNDVGTNARAGRDDITVAESDESDGSFLLLSPFVSVVTNVEADHIDHWGSYEALRDAFAAFVGRTDREGACVVPVGLADLAEAAGDRRVVTFGEGGDVSAASIEPSGTGISFTLTGRGRAARVHLRVPGRHNVENALATAAACVCLGVEIEAIAAGLGDYRGVERRFQIRGSRDGVTVVDDYAHHPSEVRATLAAARPGPWKRVVAVFQPHRYSRTERLGADFGAAFEGADRVIVTEIFGAGEQPRPGVSGKLVADSIATSLFGRPVAYLPHRDELLAYLRRVARPGDVVLTLGAGDITSVGEELLERTPAP